MQELIRKIKLRVNQSEELIIELIYEAVEEIKDFCRQDEAYVMSNMQTIIVQLVVLKGNRLGNEGIAQFTSSGITEAYEQDIPVALKKQMYRHRRMRS